MVTNLLNQLFFTTSLNDGCLPVAGFCNSQAAAASQRQFQTKVATDVVTAVSARMQSLRSRRPWPSVVASPLRYSPR